ncbi:MAG: serine/threonine-protein kinase [Gemmatimonadales bacterium]
MEGRYAVEREIGRGGASRVYLAQDPTGRPVALKVLHPELLVSIAADRFLREIRLISSLEHPHICPLIDSGEHEWLVFYVMPFLEGPTLSQHLTRTGRMPPDAILRLAGDLLSALGYAHEQQVVHRDVKPDNIVLTSNGAVLLDFGIARAIAISAGDRLTRSGVAVGTSSYMSPEQIAAQEIDHRSDLYSLGCVLFECLAGHPPFRHPNESMVLQMHRTEPAPDVSALRQDLPPPLARAVLRAMAKRREDRWQSAGEMLAALGGRSAST